MSLLIKFLLVFLLVPVLLIGQTVHTVRPNDADPQSGAPNNFHFIYIDESVQQKNKLFLFFPGTGAVPFVYREILQHAASLGYHSIGLTYPNSDAINQICLTTTDTTCHSRARLEIFDGIDRHSDIDVDEYNCIERRTLKLLEYLDNEHPDENWGQYISDGEIMWENIIVSGHSQGGGHAGIISKIKNVERVAMFAAMDWIGSLSRNADWITWEGETPEDKYYGLAHDEDEMVNFNTLLTTWENYGMSDFGSKVLVDTANTPYNNSRQLYTQVTPANDPSKFHGAMVVDNYTPMDSGEPILAPVWTYMIEGGDETLNIESNDIELLSAYPNPVQNKLKIDCSDCGELTFSIINSQGSQIKKGEVINQEVDLFGLPKGVYFLRLNEKSKHYSTLKVVKD